MKLYIDVYKSDFPIDGYVSEGDFFMQNYIIKMRLKKCPLGILLYIMNILCACITILLIQQYGPIRSVQLWYGTWIGISIAKMRIEKGHALSHPMHDSFQFGHKIELKNLGSLVSRKSSGEAWFINTPDRSLSLIGCMKICIISNKQCQESRCVK